MGPSIFFCLALFMITTVKAYVAHSAHGDGSTSRNLHQTREGATPVQVDLLSTHDVPENLIPRKSMYMIKSVNQQRNRWGRSAPGSELIQQSETQENVNPLERRWPSSAQENTSPDVFQRSTRATGTTSLTGPSRARPAAPTTAPEAPEDEDVYEPYAGERLDLFDWKLCREMNALAPGNAAVSPVGVKMVLGLLNEAASRGAAAELMRALSLPTGRSAARQAFRSVLNILQENKDGYVMKVANRIYLDTSLQPLRNISYIYDMFYSAPIEQVNFEKPLAVKQKINSWVMNFTNGQIPNLITNEHQLDRVVSMILNVIYFKGQWLYPFPKEDVAEGRFYVTPNKTVKVEYMNLKQDLYYTESEKLDAKIVRLPYKGKKYSMIFVLPNEKGNFDKMLQRISPKAVRTLLRNLTKTDVRVKIPKFKFDFSIELKEVLQKVGIVKIFEGDEDINLATVKTNVGISKIIQKVGFEVNEEGTEASSAVAVHIADKWGGTQPFIATHPFIFFIEDEKTGTIVFIGKVVNPAHNKPALHLESLQGTGKSFKSVLERDFSDDIVQQKIKNIPITSDV